MSKQIKKWLSCLILLSLLGTLVPGTALCTFGASEVIDEAVETADESSFAGETKSSDLSSGSGTDSSEGSVSAGSSSGSGSIENGSESTGEGTAYQGSGSGTGTDGSEAAEIPDGSWESGVEEAVEVPDEAADADTGAFADSEESDVDAAGEKVLNAHMAEAFPEGGTFRTFNYKTKKLEITAELQYEDALPEDAQLVVRPVTPGSTRYAYAEYLKALNFYSLWMDGAVDLDENGEIVSTPGFPEPESWLYGEVSAITRDDILAAVDTLPYGDANTMLYDVTFVVPVKVGSRIKYVEVRPEKGLVRLTWTFKRDQLADLKVMHKTDLSLFYLPFPDKIRDKYDSTMEIENPKAEDLEIEELLYKLKLYGIDRDIEYDELQYIASGASVFAICSDAMPAEMMEAGAESDGEVEIAEAALAGESSDTADESESAEGAEAANAAAEESNEDSGIEEITADPASHETDAAGSAGNDGTDAGERTVQKPSLAPASASAKTATETGMETDGAAYVNLSVTKILLNTATMQAAEDTEWPIEGFSFVLASRDESDPEGMTLPDHLTAEANAESPDATFDQIRFTAAGTYYFTIQEMLPDDAVNGLSDGVRYDTDPHNVTVEVSDANGSLKVASVLYDDSENTDASEQLSVINYVTGDIGTAALSVRKLRSDNGNETTDYVVGARLHIEEAETGEVAADPMTGEELRWTTQSGDETMYIEEGEYLLVEESTPVYRKNYWSLMGSLPFVVEDGKVYIEGEEGRAEIDVLQVFDDFDMKGYLASLTPSSDGSGSSGSSDNTGGTDASGTDSSDTSASAEYVTRAPSGENTGKSGKSVEVGVTTGSSSGSSRSSGSSGGSGSSGSTRTVTVRTGSGGSSSSGTGGVRTVTITNDRASGGSTVKVATVHADGTVTTDDGTVLTKDENGNYIDPDNPDVTLAPDRVKTVTEGDAKPSASPRTTEGAPTGDANGRNASAYLLILLLASYIAGREIRLKRRRE